MHLLCVCRALKIQASVPNRFWGHCFLSACYLVNLMPSSVLNERIFIEVLTNNEVYIRHLKVFGCLCFATNLVFHDKMQDRCTPTMMMNYSVTQKGYKLLNLLAELFFVSRDVVFREHIFSFKHCKDILHQLFTAPHSSDFDEAI